MPRKPRKPVPDHTKGFTAIPVYPHRIRKPQLWERHPAVSIAPQCLHGPAVVTRVARDDV